MKLRSKAGRKHLYIPDLQVKPGVPLNHLYWIAQYAMDKDVDVVILAGDVYDMPSLSSYDRAGSKAAEGRRVLQDLDAGDHALEIFADVWWKGRYEPERHVTKGNHCKRRERYLESDAKLEGTLRDFKFADFGWKAHEFLVPVTIDGIRYSHFFPHNPRGTISQTKNGAPSARAQAQRQMCSATAGHQQGLDYSVHETHDGRVHGLIAGSCYLHDEEYMPTNNYWRGVVLKNDVHNGDYSVCMVPLDFLYRKYSRLEPAGRKTA